MVKKSDNAERNINVTEPGLDSQSATWEPVGHFHSQVKFICQFVHRCNVCFVFVCLFVLFFVFF